MDYLLIFSVHAGLHADERKILRLYRERTIIGGIKVKYVFALPQKIIATEPESSSELAVDSTAVVLVFPGKFSHSPSSGCVSRTSSQGVCVPLKTD